MSATPAEITGSSQSTGLRYVSSRIVMTTPSVANSSVLSMPLNALDESAAWPAGPVMWISIPEASVWAIVRSWLTTSPALDHPCDPRSKVTTVSMALPSVDGTGGVTLPCTPLTAPNRCTSAAAQFV